MADHTIPLYDIELGLREAAKHRQRRDEVSRATCDVADRLAGYLVRHFGPEAVETAGLALLIAAASVGGLATEAKDIQPAVLVNVIAMAGQRMVGDARAAQGGGP